MARTKVGSTTALSLCRTRRGYQQEQLWPLTRLTAPDPHRNATHGICPNYHDVFVVWRPKKWHQATYWSNGALSKKVRSCMQSPCNWKKAKCLGCKGVCYLGD